VLIVEAATGVDRKVLRPDLYGEPVQGEPTPDDVAAARAQEYALLATLLGRAPDAKLLAGLASLRGDATPLGVAHAALAQAASETTVERVEREFFNLFIGLGRGDCCPTARTISPASCTSGRWRGCARIWRPSASSAPKATANPRIMPRRFARSWRARERPPAGAAGHRSADFREASVALDRRFFADLERAEAPSLYRRIGTLGGCSWK
jgi:hypothetical protein